MRVGDARVLDRLVRGRAWIAIMAVGLMGIVFMQVSLLKLNAGISRAVTAADTFDRQNSSLREDISKLDSGERIQAVAAQARDGDAGRRRRALPRRPRGRRRARGGGDQAARSRDHRDRGAGGGDATTTPAATDAAPAAATHARRPRRPRRRRPRRPRHRRARRRRPPRPRTDHRHRAGDHHAPHQRPTAPPAAGPTAVAGGASAPQGQG